MCSKIQGAGAHFLERPEGADPAVVDQDHFAGFDVAKEARADYVERHGLAGEDGRLA